MLRKFAQGARILVVCSVGSLHGVRLRLCRRQMKRGVLDRNRRLADLESRIPYPESKISDLHFQLLWHEKPSE